MITYGGAYLVGTIPDGLRVIQAGRDMSHHEIVPDFPNFAEAGLIVVPEVTREAIASAIHSLWNEGFFDGLKTIANELKAR